jgi:hypothetical protein
MIAAITILVGVSAESLEEAKKRADELQGVLVGKKIAALITSVKEVKNLDSEGVSHTPVIKSF